MGRPTLTNATKVTSREHTLSAENQVLASPDTAPPEWFGEFAISKWNELLPLLCSVGLAEMDLTLLESYCECYATFREAQQTVQTEGQTLADAKGKQYSHPCVAMARAAAESMRKIGSSLGISAASRSRIKVPPKQSEKKDELAAFRE